MSLDSPYSPSPTNIRGWKREGGSVVSEGEHGLPHAQKVEVSRRSSSMYDSGARRLTGLQEMARLLVVRVSVLR